MYKKLAFFLLSSFLACIAQAKSHPTWQFLISANYAHIKPMSKPHHYQVIIPLPFLKSSVAFSTGKHPQSTAISPQQLQQVFNDSNFKTTPPNVAIAMKDVLNVAVIQRMHLTPHNIIFSLYSKTKPPVLTGPLLLVIDSSGTVSQSDSDCSIGSTLDCDLLIGGAAVGGLAALGGLGFYINQQVSQYNNLSPDNETDTTPKDAAETNDGEGDVDAGSESDYNGSEPDDAGDTSFQNADPESGDHWGYEEIPDESSDQLQVCPNKYQMGDQGSTNDIDEWYKWKSMQSEPYGTWGAATQYGSVNTSLIGTY